MRFYSMFLLLALLVTGHVYAQPAKKYLTAEDAILAQSKSWQKTGVAKPIQSDDGRILYPYGQYMPTLICSTFRVCDIQLEAGEIVKGIPQIGDNRFGISPQVSGAGDQAVTTLIVRPKMEGLETNLFVATNKRTYRIKLRSSNKEGGDYMHSMAFYYPEDAVEEWAAYAKEIRAKEDKREKLVQTDLGDAGFDMNKIDFDYNIEGDASFKPIRVYNNGSKTFIQYPSTVRQEESPILIVLDENKKPIAVNFRFKPYGCADADCNKSKGDMLEVDFLIKRAKLVLGEGSNQVKVDIKAKSLGWW